MCGEQGFKSVHETVHQVKFIGKGCSIFFSSVYVALLGTTGYKLLYSSRIRMVSDLAAQQQNKVINFRFVLTLVCFSALYFQIFCHWLARCTQKLDFLFNNSGLEYYTAMSCFSAQSAAIRTKTEPGIRFQQPSLIKSQVPLFSDSPPSPPPPPSFGSFCDTRISSILE